MEELFWSWKELDAGRLAGPFVARPFHSFRISPLAVVPRKTPRDFRPIHYPSDHSSDHCSVCYATIEDDIRHIKTLGPGCFLAKTDIKNAFRIIPVL